jgi:hypothetical protein
MIHLFTRNATDCGIKGSCMRMINNSIFHIERRTAAEVRDLSGEIQMAGKDGGFRSVSCHEEI